MGGARIWSWLIAGARGLCLALGLFAGVNLVASWRHPGFDPNLWWIDLYTLPNWAADGLLAATSVLLVAYAVRPVCGKWRLRVMLGCLGLMTIGALANAVAYYVLLMRGRISSSLPVPLSLVVVGLLVGMMHAVWGSRRGMGAASRRVTAAGMVVAVVAFAAGFPLLQMFLFGSTDYRRPADAILVFGARTYANGRPSGPLSDRVLSACELYRAGLAPLMVMSGGPGDGSVHETQAMQRLAEEQGVPAGAIVRDEQGLNTQASVDRLAVIGEQYHLGRILAVSHYWHLPRIKLAAGRRAYPLYTVPCHETRTMVKEPYYLAREVAAFWKYYGTVVLRG